VFTLAPGGNWNREGAGESEYFVISKLVESVATFTYPRIPSEVEQIVLVPGVPGALKSTQFMAKPLTVLVEELTLSPANPAASEKSRRNPIQWAGV
jgi:hypothetical protein